MIYAAKQGQKVWRVGFDAPEMEVVRCRTSPDSEECVIDNACNGHKVRRSDLFYTRRDCLKHMLAVQDWEATLYQDALNESTKRAQALRTKLAKEKDSANAE